MNKEVNRGMHLPPSTINIPKNNIFCRDVYSMVKLSFFNFIWLLYLYVTKIIFDDDFKLSNFGNILLSISISHCVVWDGHEYHKSAIHRE